MSSANATARVTVSLIDRLSAPARIIQNSMRGIRGDMAALSGARLGISRQLDDAAARASKLRSSLLGVGATGLVASYGLKRVMKPGTDFETTLVDIRQKADLTGEATKRLGDRIKELGPKVNRSAAEVAKGVDFLMGMGLDSENAMGMMPAIGKAATTYRAQIEDLAKASFAAFDNMKVPADRMAKSLDVMVTAGKLGGFEIKDMAREFPSLTAAAEALGIKGVSGVAKLSAALQIARKGAADGSEAATNTANLMQKIISPETTKKFAKAGIDIRKELKKTQAAGGDPFVMIAEQIKKATKGDLSKLGDFFEDAQVQKFLRPLIANLDKYKEIRDKSGAAEGTVEADFKIRMATFQAVIDRTSQAFERLAVSVGESLVPLLTSLSDKLVPLLDGVTRWVTANGELASNFVMVAGGALGLYAAFKTLALGVAVARISMLAMSRGLLNHLAPKGGPKAPATGLPAGSGPKGAPATLPAPASGAVKPGASVPTVPKTGGVGTVEAPRPMTPAELAKAGQKFNPIPRPGATSLKGGLAGAAASIIGETLIDKFFDMMPKPAYPVGYDPKAQLAMGIGERIAGMRERWRVPETERPEPHRLDAGDFERSRRVQDERKADPEGARGRAMQQRDRYAAEADVEKSRAGGEQAGAAFAQGLAVASAVAEAAFARAFDRMIATGQAKLAGADLSITVTPRLAGAGAALRGIHSDTGIN